MRLALHPHPDTPCAAVERLEVDVTRTAGGLKLRYRLTGRLGELAVPAPATPARTDELWRQTCFEAFVRPEGGEGYLEFNLSPSGQWAAYRFDGYRSGMSPLQIAPPAIEVRAGVDVLELTATLRLDAVGQLGLSAVIEDRGGAISYWALAHPPGRPDFHHADCFAAELPATERP